MKISCAKCPVPDSVCDFYYDCPRDIYEIIKKYVEKPLTRKCYKVKECWYRYSGRCISNEVNCFLSGVNISKKRNKK
jgi:hypothetical protein